MSIFTRDCPVCAASHPINAVRCGCGYCFDPNKLDGVTQELEVISQEEQLYQDYLAARAVQAEDELRIAKAAVSREPSNTVKSAEALLAEQTAMNARAELEAQNARATAVKNRIKVVRSNRRTKRVKKAAAALPLVSPPPIREAMAPRKPAPIPVLVSTPPAPASTPKPVAAAPTRAKAPSVTSSPRPAPSSPISTTVVNIETRQRQEVTPPPAASRAAQPAVQEATPAFRTSQKTKAEQIADPVPPKSATQDCPNCSGKVPANAQRCGCGYELPSSANQMPSLSMSAEDRAAMLAALGLARGRGS